MSEFFIIDLWVLLITYFVNILYFNNRFPHPQLVYERFIISGTKLRPSTLSLKTNKSRSTQSLGHIELKESDFYALQATLQTEARIALAQAKEMARIQMEVIRNY